MTSTMQKRNGVQQISKDNALDQIFNNTLRRFFDANLWDIHENIASGMVPVNVRETGQQYEIDVIAPGCAKEKFKVQVQNSQLEISFTQDDQKNESDEKIGWVRNEYVQGSFTRIFTLDDTVDTENINAQYVDGILRVIIPKNEKALPRMLSIDVK